MTRTTLVAEFADARHAVVDGAGHWVQHDQLDRFLELVEDFLELTPPPAGPGGPGPR